MTGCSAYMANHRGIRGHQVFLTAVVDSHTLWIGSLFENEDDGQDAVEKKMFISSTMKLSRHAT